MNAPNFLKCREDAIRDAQIKKAAFRMYAVLKSLQNRGEDYLHVDDKLAIKLAIELAERKIK